MLYVIRTANLFVLTRFFIVSIIFYLVFNTNQYPNTNIKDILTLSCLHSCLHLTFIMFTSHIYQHLTFMFNSFFMFTSHIYQHNYIREMLTLSKNDFQRIFEFCVPKYLNFWKTFFERVNLFKNRI
jgi:hypothetical protein